MHIDHVTLRTTDLAATRAFFLAVFDLQEGLRPKAIQRIPGHWLYAGDAPIVHLIGAQGGSHEQPANGWDHAGFRLTGYGTFRAKLDALHLPYSPMDLPELHERRLFLHAPGGPLIEAVFRDEGPDHAA